MLMNKVDRINEAMQCQRQGSGGSEVPIISDACLLAEAT